MSTAAPTEDLTIVHFETFEAGNASTEDPSNATHPQKCKGVFPIMCTFHPAYLINDYFSQIIWLRVAFTYSFDDNGSLNNNEFP